MAVVYQHRRKDDNSIFYIGIGTKKNRAYSLDGRNRYWHNVVKKYGYEVDVLFEGISWEDACNVEMGMIESYGRKDLELGNLVNLTDGGDGSYGVILSKEARGKISQSAIGKKKRLGMKHTEETKLKISKTKKNPTKETRDLLSFKAKNRTKEHQDKITKSKLGNSYRSKEVINIETKEIFKSAKEVSILHNINYATLKAWLIGKNPNNSNFRYLTNDSSEETSN
jgi:PHP family Zn ribbon phosphoesterase